MNHRSTTSSRGFSLIEVLLAVFILGIGLIMVASLFPVGADWTRQSSQDSIAQVVAQDALGVIQTHYGKGGNLYTPTTGFAALPAPTPGSASQLFALPGLTSASISLNERCYQFGSSQPFPAANPNNCNYFWTALARRSPVGAGMPTANATNNYDLFILVFNKGDISHTYNPSVGTEVAGTRNTTEKFIPAIVSIAPSNGTFRAATGAVDNPAPVPGMGQFGIGAFSGTVFRQILTFSSGVPSGSAPSPALSSADSAIIYAPPADNTNSGSPLVYVFQTTISQ